jgi:hypothetical protein
MATYPNRFVLMTIIGYPIFVKNDEFFGIPNENGYLYNKVCTKPIETLEGSHYSSFKVVHVSFGVRKFVAVNPNVKVLVNLISRMYFHDVITIKIIALDPRGNPLDTMKKPCPLQLGYVVVTLFYQTF